MRPGRTASLCENDSALLALAVAHSPTVFYVASLDGAQGIRFISPNIERLTGHKPSDFLADPAYGRRFLHPDDQAAYHQHLAELAERGGCAHEYRFRCTDGRYLWFRDQLTLAEEASGQAGCFIGCMIDITEEKRGKAALQDAVDSLQSGFSISGPDERLLMCNRAFAAVYGQEPSALIGMPRERIISAFLKDVIQINGKAVGDPAAEARRIIAKLRAQGPDSLEMECQDGRWYLVTSAPTRDGGSVTIRTDITRQKQNDRELRNSEDLIRQVLEACPVPVGMSRAKDGVILYESPASQQLYKRDTHRSEISARAHFVDPRERDRYLALLRRDGSLEGFEVELKRSDGTRFWGEISARLIDYRGQEMIVSSTIDQTERRQVSQEMARQREVLHQSEKLGALGELLAGVAHELNNPLSIVVGQALLLRELTEDPVIAQRAERIGKAADRCARIVKTFLSMARQRPSKNAALSIKEVVESALEVTAYSLRSAGVAVEVNLAADLPAVRGDTDQLNQVLTNLIVNAQNALQDHQGPRTLKVNAFYRQARGEVVIKVKDSGPGIPEAIRSRIFEPFFTTKEVGAGTGIGLAFCHRVIEAHGGRIKVASKPGEGASFVIALPANLPAQKEPALQTAAPAPRAGLRILMIDDESDVQEILSETLRGQGHHVDAALSGAEALNLLGSHSYDIILSDLRMPGLDGPGLYAHLNDRAPELISRLGFVTGDAMSPAVRSFLKAARRPYIEKPATPSDLRDLIARLTNSA